MRNIRAVPLAVVFVVVLHSAALAEPEAPDMAPTPLPAQPSSTGGAPPSRPTAAPREWYGYEIMLMDVAALGGGLLIGSQNESNLPDRDWQQTGDVIASTWGVGMIGAFSVHAAHDNAGLGLAGTSARLLMPPVAAVLGVGAHCIGVGGDDPCSAAGGRGGFVVGMIGASLLDALAFARAETHEPDASIEGERVWYGYQTLVIDGAALVGSLAITLGGTDPERVENGARMLGLPYLVGFLVSPWVHAFHGRVGTAFGSLAFRALVPAVGAVPGIIGACAASGSARGCRDEGAVWGLFGGTLLVAAIDIGAMSFERVSPAETSRTMVMPYVMPTEDGRGLHAGFSGSM